MTPKTPPSDAHRPPPWLVVSSAALLVGVGLLAALASGAAKLDVNTVIGALAVAAGFTAPEGLDPVAHTIVLSLRLPRAIGAIFVGAALAVAGALVQGWLRNPLADPGLLGVSGGAALGAALAIVAPWGHAGAVSVSVAAMLGAFVAVVLVYHLGASSGHDVVSDTILAGLAIGAISSAGVGLLVTVANDQALRDLSFWTLGSVGSVSWATLKWLAPVLSLALVFALRISEALDLLLLGEMSAVSLGLDPTRLMRQVSVLVAVLVGCAVAACGPIAFVGLLAPHMVRLCAGPQLGRLMPATALTGAALLLFADTLARTVAAPVELPVGVLTTLLGGPTFVWLLRRRGRP